jgi:hypothetical protein
MYPIRTAPTARPPAAAKGKKGKAAPADAEVKWNTRIVETPATDARETNLEWLARVGARGEVVLIGGSSLVDFRLRVAQSHLRHDFTPSYWSQVGLWLDGSRELWTVPLDARDASSVPARNGVERRALADVDDPVRFPNLAVFRFTRAAASEIRGAIAQLSSPAPRDILDVPGLLVPWLAFVWGAAESGNPILKGTGVPSAAFAQAVFATLQQDLAPGIPPAASCPEAIWQAAKWWHVVYGRIAGAKGSTTLVPEGSYVVRQKFAALVSEP